MVYPQKRLVFKSTIVYNLLNTNHGLNLVHIGGVIRNNTCCTWSWPLLALYWRASIGKKDVLRLYWCKYFFALFFKSLLDQEADHEQIPRDKEIRLLYLCLVCFFSTHAMVFMLLIFSSSDTKSMCAQTPFKLRHDYECIFLKIHIACMHFSNQSIRNGAMGLH